MLCVEAELLSMNLTLIKSVKQYQKSHNKWPWVPEHCTALNGIKRAEQRFMPFRRFPRKKCMQCVESSIVQCNRERYFTMISNELFFMGNESRQVASVKEITSAFLPRIYRRRIQSSGLAAGLSCSACLYECPLLRISGSSRSPSSSYFGNSMEHDLNGVIITITMKLTCKGQSQRAVRVMTRIIRTRLSREPAPNSKALTHTRK